MKSLISVFILLYFYNPGLEAKPSDCKSFLTDRIGLGESAQTLKKNTWEIDIGVNYSWSENILDGSTSLLTPNLIGRIRYFKFLEFRIVTEYLIPIDKLDVSAADSENITGLSFLSLGSKVAILKEGKYLPTTALILMFGLNETESQLDYVTENMLSIRILNDKSLSDKISCSLNAGFLKFSENEHWQGDETFTLAYQTSDRLEYFFETWSNWDLTTIQRGINLGVYIKPLSLLKMELTGGIGTDGFETQLFMNGGLAITAN